MSAETIFALSSAPGRAGVAVLRVSGSASGAVLRRMTQGALPPARQASLRHLYDEGGSAIDRGLVLWFPGPASFTGEDLVEFHVHGGRAVVAALINYLSRQDGCRVAFPGEFTRRAFDAGKLDLAEVEGLADLVAAETEAQRRQALRQAEGGLSDAIEGWTSTLTEVLAHVEADIEFPDEDIEGELNPRILNVVSDTEQELSRALDDRKLGERLRDGFSAVLLGAPNVGKSSLMNRLAQRDVAIVSEQAGTTRDVIEVSLDLVGYPLTLSDTAGLRDQTETAAVGPIEEEGMRRSLKRAREADLKLLVVDGACLGPQMGKALPDELEGALTVVNKVDLLGGHAGVGQAEQDSLRVSAKTGEGLDELVQALEARLAILADGRGEAPIITRARHRQALEDCREALRRGLKAESGELLAEDLRLALRALGRIVGTVDIEDVLDVVFRDFCIGK